MSLAIHTSVFAKTVNKFAKPPLLIQILLPFNIHVFLSSDSCARVLMEAASDPLPASVRQKAAIHSPVARRGR